jgi:four helix bundle protein
MVSMTTMGYNPTDLRTRTKRFALGIIRLCRALPRSEEGRIISRQLLRAGTSVGANYRAACRARSKAEFVAKLGIVLEESDESVFWLELLTEAGIGNKPLVQEAMKEANELTSIFVSSVCTAKATSSSHVQHPSKGFTSAF